MIFPKLVLATLVLSFAGGGCSKEESKSEASSISPLPAKEVERGRKACEAYVARVCKCAETKPEMAEECALAKARPEAFDLNVGLAETPGLSDVEFQAVKLAAKKIAAACFEDTGKLDAAQCP